MHPAIEAEQAAFRAAQRNFPEVVYMESGNKNITINSHGGTNGTTCTVPRNVTVEFAVAEGELLTHNGYGANAVPNNLNWRAGVAEVA